MKGVFIGTYEFNKFGVNKIKDLVKEYNFTHLFVSEECISIEYNLVDDLRKVLLKDCVNCCLFAWVKYKSKSEDCLVNQLLNLPHYFTGVVLDYVRVKDSCFGLVKGVKEVNNISNIVNSVKEKCKVKGFEWLACFKCEAYFPLLSSGTGCLSRLKEEVGVISNDFNRLCWGQSIRKHEPLFNKILLMSYHQEYNVSSENVTSLVKKLQKKYSNKIIPIWQTYQDNPTIDYELLWQDVIEESKKFKDNTYFRLGTCDLDSFK